MNYQHEEEAEGVEIVPNAWSSELPADILGMITDNLPLSQFIRFGSVCLGWRSFSTENYQHIKLPNQLPVLLIPIPPSSLLLTDHHQKNISFSYDDDDEEEEEEEEEEELELELDEKEEKVTTHKEEEEKETGKENDIVKEIEEENDIEKEEENDIEKDKVKEKEEEEEIGEEEEEEEEDDEEEEEIGEEKEEEEEDDDEEEDEGCHRLAVFKIENYYDPKEIWQGQDAKQRYKSTRTFYSLSENRVYHDFRLPVPYYKNVLGSCYGWLVTVQECHADNGEIYLPVSLINPFRTDNNEIQLPRITNGNPGNLDNGEGVWHSYFLKKVILSANPSSLSEPTTQLLVFGIYGQFKLAFCRPCDKAWTPLHDLEEYRAIQDIICYQGQIYTILQNGWVFAFVLDDSQSLPMPIVTLEISPPNEVGRFLIGHVQRYLVESGGDLLQIRRTICPTTTAESGRSYPPTETQGYITCQFLVFKLDPTGQWVEMKTLDDHMLFIGTSSSISLSASDFPGWSKPNSIYYTDNYVEAFLTEPLEGPHDMGIFNLEDGSFERHYEAESMTVMPPPIWIQPML